ncbi:MAG: 5-formyltetrahydrofolate cyclo-ligase [Clostridium sp.]|jgi:5-formyltetrahydrofolate cyclo-ligase|uniref:5-formyltetrahydrofolate cyclo-ligase n=2 Tax=Clostridium TaxID=1485 RepID=UPI001FA839FB|nr:MULTISPECIES: 5-formyltetrahydrofolate cyclo-ligase [Clostridium]MDB1933876.1 5-formyltetrahydrofolate cyclo-ligase [Clostridium tertium]MDB1936607.1 5-formyltetrahydrofolate cyclo-ligase [Clostridium tertium]MDB1943497.1 5-formyltetrahydrofolate cyclo-ligase [Clostridium tertium]MDB1951465.1 5-formyltetrahydrofolate cyclo-ligase [Clostridium tertium]MDB1970781.1 5-formyltetrahydrofolate cyclo-ligase [Clostridium tertium]
MKKIMNKEEKKVLRNKILEIRDSLNNNEKELIDNKIFNELINTDLYKRSINIFIYISFSNEINTRNIIEKAFKDKKNVFIPKVYKDDKLMKAIKLNSIDELKKNSMGILEPIDDSNYIEKENIDLIVVPGVVFDKECNRIGYGGGYYDRYLKDIKSKKNKIALAYDLQIVDKIESEVHDIKVDYIITNTRALKNTNNG